MSINDVVIEALCKQGVNERVWTVENAAKYSATALPSNSPALDEWLSTKIFSLMSGLNSEGMTQEGLCADAQGAGSVGATLRDAAKDLAARFSGQTVHYVELGPEPIKTSLLLDALVEGGVQLQCYTAIDINEMSRTVMHSLVASKFPDEHSVQYRIMNFHDLKSRDLQGPQAITLVTMLGFQEGNELPGRMAALLDALASANTYVLSEMQLSLPDTNTHIHNFYNHPCMQHFSTLVGMKMKLDRRDKHRVVVLPIELDGETYSVAATLLPVTDGQEEGLLLTNVCLKYSRQQFQHVRQRAGYGVVTEHCSGDGSVVYQLSRPCAITRARSL